MSITINQSPQCRMHKDKLMLSPNLKQQHQSFNLKTHWVLFHGEMLHMVEPFEGDRWRHGLLVQLLALGRLERSSA